MSCLVAQPIVSWNADDFIELVFHEEAEDAAHTLLASDGLEFNSCNNSQNQSWNDSSFCETSEARHQNIGSRFSRPPNDD